MSDTHSDNARLANTPWRDRPTVKRRNPLPAEGSVFDTNRTIPEMIEFHRQQREAAIRRFCGAQQ